MSKEHNDTENTYACTSQPELEEIRQLLQAYKSELQSSRWLNFGIFKPKRLLAEVEIAEALLDNDEYENNRKLLMIRAWAGAQGSRFVNVANKEANDLRKAIYKASEQLPAIYENDKNESKVLEKPESFLAKLKSKIKKKKSFFRKSNFFDRFAERVTNLNYQSEAKGDDEVSNEEINHSVLDAVRLTVNVAEVNEFTEEVESLSNCVVQHERECKHNESMEEETEEGIDYANMILSDELKSLSSSIDEYSCTRSYIISDKLFEMLKRQRATVIKASQKISDEISYVRLNSAIRIEEIRAEWGGGYGKDDRNAKVKQYEDAGEVEYIAHYRASLERSFLLLDDLTKCINDILIQISYARTLQPVQLKQSYVIALLHEYQLIIVDIFDELMEREYIIDYPRDRRLVKLKDWASERLSSDNPPSFKKVLVEEHASSKEIERIKRKQACYFLRKVQGIMWDSRPAFSGFIGERALNGNKGLVVAPEHQIWSFFRKIDPEFSIERDILSYHQDPRQVCHKGNNKNTFLFLALLAYIPELIGTHNTIINSKVNAPFEQIMLLTYHSPLSAFLYSDELGISDAIEIFNDTNRVGFSSRGMLKDVTLYSPHRLFRTIPLNLLIDGARRTKSKLGLMILFSLYYGYDPKLYFPENAIYDVQVELIIASTVSTILMHTIRTHYSYWLYLYKNNMSGLYQNILSISDKICAYCKDNDSIAALSYLNTLYELTRKSLSDCYIDNGVNYETEILFVVQNYLVEFGLLNDDFTVTSVSMYEIYPLNITGGLSLNTISLVAENSLEWANRVLQYLSKIGESDCYNAIDSSLIDIQNDFNEKYASENLKMYFTEINGCREYAFSEKNDLTFFQKLTELMGNLGFIAQNNEAIGYLFEKPVERIPFTTHELENEFVDRFTAEIKSGLVDVFDMQTLVNSLVVEQGEDVDTIEKNSEKSNAATKRGLEKIKEAEQVQIANFRWFSFFCPCASIPIDDDEIEDTLPVHR